MKALKIQYLKFIAFSIILYLVHQYLEIFVVEKNLIVNIAILSGVSVAISYIIRLILKSLLISSCLFGIVLYLPYRIIVSLLLSIVSIVFAYYYMDITLISKELFFCIVFIFDNIFFLIIKLLA